MTVAIDSSDEANATSVLMLAPDVGGSAARAAADLVANGPEPVDQVIAVTVGQSARSWLDEWNRANPAATGATAVTCVDVDGDTRSAARGESLDADERTTIERVRDPQNLERVGRRVSDVLQRADEEDERVCLTVHSVSDVLQHVDDSTAFKFVYTLGEVVRTVDGTAYFHLDPESYDEETVETFRVVCDAVAELDYDVPTGEASE